MAHRTVSGTISCQPNTRPNRGTDDPRLSMGYGNLSAFAA
jgi:hypothetical protein